MTQLVPSARRTPARRIPFAVAAAAASSAAIVLLAAAPAHAAATCDGRAATIEVPATDYDTAPVVGTPGDDVIVGTPGRDTIDGAGGNDVICGLGGPDTLAGGEGDDRLFGGLDMEYSIDDGYRGDLVSPGPGNDHVDLGADLISIRGYDNLDDAIDYGRYLIPLVRQELAHRDATGRRGEVVAQPPLEAERELAEVPA